MATSPPSAPPLQVGDLLPPGQLPPAGDGRALRLRWPPNGTTILVLPHPGAARTSRGPGDPGGCAACGDYLAAVARHAEDYRNWDARPVAVVAPEGPGTAASPPETDPTAAAGVDLPVVVDTGGLRERCGLGHGAGVLVADRFGQVHRVEVASPDHDLPDPVEDLLEEVRHLGIMCPECGVPDEPGRGAWAGEDQAGG